MEVSRLATALSLLTEDFERRGIRARFEALVAAAKAAAGNPAEAALQETFSAEIEQLSALLTDAQANQAPISVITALHEIGADALVGSQMKVALDRILRETPFLLPRAAKSLERLNNSVVGKYQKAAAALVALQALGVQPGGVALEQYEAGILMPSSFTGDDLRAIKNHLHSWLRHLDTIEELVLGRKRESIPVNSVSSGSFDLFLSMDPKGAFALLLLAKGAAMIIQSVRDATRRREELESVGYPESVITEMKKHEETLIEKGTVDIETRILERRSADVPDTRLNELKTGLRHAIDYTLKSVNRGVDVEVSVPKNAEAQTDADQAIIEMRSEIARLNAQLAEIIKSLPPRTEPLLSLPEPSSEGPGQAQQ